MKEEQKIFYAISLLSVYIYLKNKYDTLAEIGDKDFNNNVKDINKLLLKLEKYAFLPDQDKLIEKSYKDILDRIKENKIAEEDFFEQIKSSTVTLSKDDKSYILNSVIYVANEDRKISEVEKKLIIQGAYFLELDRDFDKIMLNYKASDFTPSYSNKSIIAGVVLVMALLIGGAYIYYKYSVSKINIFNQKRVVFTEVSFNRFVVYKNKYDVDNLYFKKQAVFFLSGKAEIGFNPENIKYDNINNILTVLYQKNSLFVIKPSFNPYLVVDRTDPEPISLESARKVGAIVGIAGAAVGAKVGNVLGSILPTPYRLAATVAGGAMGGAGAYWITSSALEGMQLSKEISKSEEQLVVETSEVLITSLLKSDKTLQDMYKDRFEEYIKFKYSNVGYKIKNIKYSEITK